MKTKRIAETQLDRIENALRVLLERVVFPARNAFDGIKGDELKEAIEREQRHIKETIERIFSTGDIYD